MRSRVRLPGYDWNDQPICGGTCGRSSSEIPTGVGQDRKLPSLHQVIGNRDVGFGAGFASGCATWSALPKSCLFLAALATIGLFGLWLTHVIAYGLRVTMFESRRSSQFEIGTEMARRKMLVRAVSAVGGMAVMTLASVALPKSHWPTAMKWPATSLAGVRGQDMGRARAVLAAIAAGGVVALRASPPLVVLHC